MSSSMNASTRSRKVLLFSESSKTTTTPLTTAGEPILAQHHGRRNPGEDLGCVDLGVVMGREASESRHGGDEPTVDLQGDAGYIRGGGGEQEGRRPPQLCGLAVAAQGYSLANIAALLLGRDAEVLGPRLVERAGAGGVDAPWCHAVDPDPRSDLFRQALDERRYPGTQHVRGIEALYRLAHRR